METNVKYLVDEYAKWDRLQKEAKVETEKIKLQLQEMAIAALEDTKLKTVKYYGTNNNVAIISISETVKMAPFLF